MRKTVCFVLLAMSACAEGVEDVDANSPVSPVDSGFPTVTVINPPEDVDGEYTMRVDPVSYFCNGAFSDEPVAHALANVVEQNNGTTFDMTPRGISGFYDFTHRGIERRPGGFFEDDESFEWYITPGAAPAIFTITATGSAISDSLAFLNHWIVGWYDGGGVFNPICDITYDNVGSRRYPNWDGTHRSSADGQWRVWHENLENSFGSLDEPGFQAIDVVTQNISDSVFDLKWGRVNINNVPRAADGSVSVSFWNGNSLFVVSGVVENDHLDLTITWDAHDEITGAVLWHIQDRYTGAPRFQPHLVGNPEPLTGAFNVELTQTYDSCDGVLDTRRYVVEAMPVDDGQIWLWIAGLKPPPFIPNADGSFDFVFYRQDGFNFTYNLTEGNINSDSISFKMHAEARWPDGLGDLSGEIYCTSDYVATGGKRYSNLFPPQP